MRGSTPLDVAASSVMDNNGLALALEEPDLDKVGDAVFIGFVYVDVCAFELVFCVYVFKIILSPCVCY